MKQYLFIASILLFFSCNLQASKDKSVSENVTLATQDEQQIPVADTAGSPAPAADEPEPVKSKAPSSSNPDSKPDWDKKIIRNATLNLEVKDYKKYMQLMQAAAVKYGGYVADEQQTETGYKIENTVTIKVPVAQFQAAVDALTTGDMVINEKKITSEDVTSQYVDTRARLEAKRQVRLRYLELLNQAKNMEEILQVQTEINSITEEIESATGRINYLTNAAAMSTISITVYQVLNENANSYGEESFWQQVKDAFAGGWGGIKNVLVGLIYLWPFIIALAGGFFLIKRYRINKRKTAQQ